MASKLVFATVGTTQFDNFIATLAQNDVLAALKSGGYGRLRVQIGNGTVIPPEGTVAGVDVSYYRFKDSIQQDIMDADLVISHAGAGSCLEVLEARKPLLVVINEDLMNNHQTELAQQLSEDGHLHWCMTKTLVDKLLSMDLTQLTPFPRGNAHRFTNFLDQYMGFKLERE